LTVTFRFWRRGFALNLCRVLPALTKQLQTRTPLTEEQVGVAVAALVDENIAAETKADFLAALAHKGETVAEIAAFARALRAKSIAPPLDAAIRAGEILDVVGTGGDQLGTFNISTTVAILCAAAGVAVAKHGNRAVTSSVGSADVIETLGIKVDFTPADAAQALREHGFVFLFAPHYHPAFKHIAPARKLCAARKQRTVFNILGPLLNPVQPTAQLVGVPRPDLCEPLARVLQTLGVRRAMVVSGEVLGAGLEALGKSLSAAPDASRPTPRAFLDEFSTLGETTVAEFYQDRGFTVSTLAPENFPLQPATLADLAGGDKFANAEIIRRILRGDERGPKRDAVLLNAAAALFVAGKTKSLVEGWDLAATTIDGGAAAKKLAALAKS
jgi:anthranilate phosphoribosyltransferase